MGEQTVALPASAGEPERGSDGNAAYTVADGPARVASGVIYHEPGQKRLHPVNI